MSNPYKLRFASIRRWPVGEKWRIVEQTLKPGASVARVAKAHGVNANQVFIGADIRRNFLAKIPASAAGGEKGIVVVRFQIQKDGTLPDKSATILSSSGKKDMDAAALSAIRTAAPFARLPEGYAATTLDLQFSFYYNSEPQEPAQKPKVVPVGTAANHIRESITIVRP